MEIGEVVVTKDEQGRIALVTRQDDEGRILSVIAESKPWPKKLAPTYFVLHPDGSYTAADPQPYLPDLDQPAGEPVAWPKCVNCERDKSEHLLLNFADPPMIGEAVLVCPTNVFKLPAEPAK